MSKFLNKGLKEEEKEEGTLKILKNIEDKNKKQLKAIEDQGNKQSSAIKNINTGSKSLKAISFFSGLRPEAKQLMNEIKEEESDIDPKKLVQILIEKCLTLTPLNSRLNLLQVFMMAR